MADHRFPGEHVIDEMVLEAPVTQKILDEMSDFPVVDGDLIIATYPKAGTTWMEELTWLIRNDGDTEKASKTYLYERMFYMEYPMDGVNTGLHLFNKAPRPALAKTHLRGNTFDKLINEGKLKFIVVIRNPKDTLISYYNFYRMNKNLANFSGSWHGFFELYKTKHLLYGDYFDWYASWIPYLGKANVELVAYEDMHYDIEEVIGRLAKFMGKTLDPAIIPKIIEHTSFDKMKNNNMTNHSAAPFFDAKISPFMRKGKVGDWKNHFTQEQSDYIDARYKETLESKGVVIKFE